MNDTLAHVARAVMMKRYGLTEWQAARAMAAHHLGAVEVTAECVGIARAAIRASLAAQPGERTAASMREEVNHVPVALDR